MVGLVGVGRVGGGSVVGVDVVLVDGVSGVSRVDSSGVVNERSGGLVSGRSSSGVDVGRSHGRDGSEVLLTSGASLAGSSEADGDGSVKLATGSSDDEPDTGREVKMGVGESEVVNTVSGYDEESEVKTKGNDSNDESEESGEGTEDTKDEVGTESEDEGDQGKTSGNRSKDEGEGQVAEDVLRGDGSAGKTSDEVDWISERRSRTLSTETISPITESDSSSSDLSLEVSNVVPHR